MNRHIFNYIKNPGRKIIPLVFSAGILFGVFTIAAAGFRVHEPSAGSTTSAPELTSQGRDLLKQFSTAFEAAAAKVNPSVVPIFSEQVTQVASPFGGTDDPFRQFFGDDFLHRFFGSQSGSQKQTVRSLGSGVIISSDGYILTNNHVVDGAQKLTVVLQDKKKYSAKVVGRDPQTDVAVIKIDANGLPAAALGNSDSVSVGEWVIAVGNPFQLMHTVTAGIISAKGRSSVNLAEYEDFIQTDASINPGNSGGALADLDGKVIGINTAILSPSGAGGNVGIGFAIPINMAKSIMERLIEHGRVSRGYLGIVPQDIDEGLARALKLKSASGALVGDVTKDGPADKGGLKTGDVITRFNKTDVENSTQLRNLVAEAAPGSKADIEVLRDGKRETLTVTLGDRPTNEQTADKAESGTESATKLGLGVRDLTPDVLQQLGIKSEEGVVVASVTAGSPADDAGMRKGDIIKQVDRRGISSVREFRQALQTLKSGDSVALLVRRGDATFYVALDVP